MKKRTLAMDIIWDLSEFYTGIDDPQIEKDLTKTEKLVEAFVKKYRGKINSPDLTAEFLLTAIEERDEISYASEKISIFASLLHSKNTTSEEIGSFYQKIVEKLTELSTKMVWFGVEWLKLDDSIAQKIIEDSKLSEYKYSLEQSRKDKPHILSEKEEELLAKTSLTGAGAFTRLFDLISTDARYDLVIEGEKKLLTFSELSFYLTQHPDRELRKKAGRAVSQGLKKNSRVYVHTMNTLLLDSKIGDEIRNYKYPQEATFLGDDLSKEVVTSMSRTVQENYSLVEKFYLKKKELGGFDELFEWDMYSDIYPDISKDYSWEESKKVILDAFYGFSSEFGRLGEMFFDKGWIDAPLLDGKRSGAFCMLGSPKIHPHVSMNFKGKSGDVTTLAHEIGHGIHAYLSQKQKLSNFYPVTPMAEIASIFAEILVFEHMYKNETNEKLKTNLLVDKLQNSFATVFRQTAFYLFESEIHSFRRKKGELALKDLNSLWQKNLQAMFGKGLTLSEDYKNRWMYVSHFYHYDFYVYSYAFGELLTLALHEISKKDSNFADKYLELLSLGGSDSPTNLLNKFGLDISSEGFWQKGLGSLSDLQNLL